MIVGSVLGRSFEGHPVASLARSERPDCGPARCCGLRSAAVRIQFRNAAFQSRLTPFEAGADFDQSRIFSSSVSAAENPSWSQAFAQSALFGLQSSGSRVARAVIFGSGEGVRGLLVGGYGGKEEGGTGRGEPSSALSHFVRVTPRDSA